MDADSLQEEGSQLRFDHRWRRVYRRLRGFVRVARTSAMLVRMRSRRPSSQMPPLGSALRDDTAIDVITRWIATELPRR
jgi:hypothetical protein